MCSSARTLGSAFFAVALVNTHCTGWLGVWVVRGVVGGILGRAVVMVPIIGGTVGVAMMMGLQRWRRILAGGAEVGKSDCGGQGNKDHDK